MSRNFHQSAAVLLHPIDAGVDNRAVESRIFEKFGAQLGEFGWHAAHADSSIDEMSRKHAASMCRLLEMQGAKAPAILEVGAYAHHSAHLAASATGGLAVTHDISPTSLAEGNRRARELGLNCQALAIAGDFHNLCFDDDTFDLTFIASAVHHTWRPWEVLREMIRVTRPGGLIRIENEPVGRLACLYLFRGNRDGLSPYEQELERLGLTRTLSSPFPGSRAEQLFGIVENDRIPLHIYQRELGAGEIVEWKLDNAHATGPFDDWLRTMPSAEAIAERLLNDVVIAARAYGERDKRQGLLVPSADAIWPLAYDIARRLEKTELAGDDWSEMLGAALSATIRKPGKLGWMQRTLDRFRALPKPNRQLPAVNGVLLDPPQSNEFEVVWENTLPEPEQAAHIFPVASWSTFREHNGHISLLNEAIVCPIDLAESDGVLILRFYSVATDVPYHLSVLVDGDERYTFCVVASESHLAKVFVRSGQAVSVRHTLDNGEPVLLRHHSRLMARFVPVRPKF
jgi:SAM-dependent methyltransferase